MVAAHVDDPGDVVVATETDRGLFVGALVAAGYTVLGGEPDVDVEISGTASPPRAPSPIRATPRCSPIWPAPTPTTIGPSPVTASSAEAVKVLARAHQIDDLDPATPTNQLRSTLREFYPAALEAFDDLAGRDALAVLGDRADPSLGRELSRSKIAVGVAARRAGNAASRNGRSRSRPPCGPSNSMRHALIADAMGATVDRPGGGDHRDAPPRSVGSRPSWPTILSSTRTPRSSAPCQDWG